jgi:hypothetical protein
VHCDWRFVWIGGTVGLLLLSPGCGCDNVGIRENLTVPMIEDTDEVRRLITAQGARDGTTHAFRLNPDEWNRRAQEFREHPEKYLPARKESLVAISGQSGVAISDAAHGVMLEQSGAICSLEAWYSYQYVKIRITTGPHKDQVGWVCDRYLWRTKCL